jgi:hypothetical protein
MRALPIPRACGGLVADEVVRTLDGWVRSYLCRPHAQLGRPGPVCPYVPAALASDSLWAAVVRDRPDHVEEVVGVMSSYRDWFATRAGPTETTRALLVAFPGLRSGDAGWAIEQAQRRCKTAFVRAGLMIGEFHDGPPAARGVRNPAFRPLRCPVPLLAVRRMVASDLPFLTADTAHLAAYRSRFPAGARPDTATR